ncbi:MAG: hypothetical protein IKR57_03260 [Bacilli bacterium]|nr:hypothetical protein [Bacilli bacterium]
MKEKTINKNILFFNLDRDILLKDINDVEILSIDRIRDNYFSDLSIFLYDKPFSNELMEFVNVIVKNFKKEDLKIFYSNIRHLDVKKFDENKYNKGKKNHTLAYYKPYNNTVYISNEINTSGIYHELFHMSTAIKYNKYLFVGFDQTDLVSNKSFGVGINEGYTQLLSERYFDKAQKGYPSLVHDLLLIENLIGKEKMESLYMQCNLYGLIDELKNYISYEDICRFITYTDYIKHNMYNKNVSDRKVAIMGQMCAYINMFIVTCYLNKYINQLPNTPEEREDMINTLCMLFNKLIVRININNKLVECSFTDNIEYLERILEGFDYLGLDCKELKQKKLV